ncbi:MAG: enoyl-CoA hydratase/isomerase family protein [Anaerolineaceae bacterium]|nr:MAG: enoyl-CoA hydratase/isomerase family protein [Anaerolineaceae bacterium]
MPQTIIVNIKPPFAAITLNRPDARNAMSQQMVIELREAFDSLRDDRTIRAIVLNGSGGTFCAGGDLKEMQTAFTDPDNDDSGRTEQFDGLLNAVQNAPQAVIAKVEGAAMGGGFGLVCASDIAIASQTATFALPEVRLGIVPALISPYVIDRIGLTHARRLMLTGARFDGAAALNYGLVHEVCPPDALDERVNATLEEIRQASPDALAACKALIFRVNRADISQTASYRARLLDDLRRGASGQEGMMAFIQKRKPAWATPPAEGDE